MDRKRKWDQPGHDEETPPKIAKFEEGGKAATDAAAAAAAIAAKIAAQFAGPAGGSSLPGIGSKDPHDAEFTHDIEINDVRNRYMLTKGATQQQILQETGASVTTKGIWYPDKSKATEKDPPLYLHISATSEEILKSAIQKVEELINSELALTEGRKREEERPRERRKWPDEKIFINLETLRNFNVRAKVVGPQGMFVKHIQSETGTRVQIKGLGSGFFDSETGKESEEPMHIHITGPDEHQIDRAKILTEDLLEVVRAEHGKARAALYQQQMAQMYGGAYGAYNAWGTQAGAAPPPPGEAPPPPPPSDAPPPPPADGAPPPPPADGSYGMGPSPQTSQDAFAQYWAAQGYDVESAQFKEWMASQQQAYAQYYAAPGQPAPPTGEAPPPPPSEAPPPPPPA